MGDPSKTASPLVNLVIRELPLDSDGSEDCPTWAILLPSLGYQVLKIYASARFIVSSMGCFSGPGTMMGYLLGNEGGN